eukprot:Gb_19845 [translate_table: standard]
MTQRKYVIVSSGLEEAKGVRVCSQKVSGGLNSIMGGGNHIDPRGTIVGFDPTSFLEDGRVYSPLSPQGVSATSNLANVEGINSSLGIAGSGATKVACGNKSKKVKKHGRDGSCWPFPWTSVGDQGFKGVDSGSLETYPWDSFIMLLKWWSLFFDARSERVDLVLVWVKLPGLSLDLWYLEVFKEINNALGIFMETGMSFLETRTLSVAHILVSYLWPFSSKLPNAGQKEDPRSEDETTSEGLKETPAEGAVMEGFSLDNAPSGDSIPIDVSHMRTAQKLVVEGVLDLRQHSVANESLCTLRK